MKQLFGGIDERFTAFADHVTEFVGKWWFTTCSAVILVLWIVCGILFIRDWFTSPAWNFPLNTITTVGEWFLEGLILAAANRVERHNQSLLEKLERQEEFILQLLKGNRSEEEAAGEA